MTARSPAAPRDLLNVAEVMVLLGISRSAAYRLAGEIPTYKLPGVGLRFRRRDVEAFVERHRGDPAARTADLRRLGTPAAGQANDDQEVPGVPGLTRRELRRQAGI